MLPWQWNNRISHVVVAAAINRTSNRNSVVLEGWDAPQQLINMSCNRNRHYVCQRMTEAFHAVPQQAVVQT